MNGNKLLWGILSLLATLIIAFSSYALSLIRENQRALWLHSVEISTLKEQARQIDIFIEITRTGQGQQADRLALMSERLALQSQRISLLEADRSRQHFP